MAKTSVLQPWWPYDGRIPPDATCWLCGAPAECRHHVYFGNPGRRISEANGLWVYLCNFHHNASKHGVHFDRELDMLLKRTCQRMFEKGDPERHDLFMSLIGRNYL